MAGKGDRNRSDYKKYSKGFDQINWGKKKKYRKEQIEILFKDVIELHRPDIKVLSDQEITKFNTNVKIETITTLPITKLNCIAKDQCQINNETKE